jgi:hypothetical protein
LRRFTSPAQGLRDRIVAPLMEVINKLIDIEEALVNQFDHDGK